MKHILECMQPPPPPPPMPDPVPPPPPTPPPSPPPSAIPCNNWLTDEKIPFYDVAYAIIADRYACLAQCQATINCGALTHYPSGHCYMKDPPSTATSVYGHTARSIRLCTVLRVRPVCLSLVKHVVPSLSFVCGVYRGMCNVKQVRRSAVVLCLHFVSCG